MRILLVLIAFCMIAVPALLALAGAGQPRGRRIANALVIFLAPAFALGLIHGVCRNSTAAPCSIRSPGPCCGWC